jgi:hypothetical protein
MSARENEPIRDSFTDVLGSRGLRERYISARQGCARPLVAQIFFWMYVGLCFVASLSLIIFGGGLVMKVPERLTKYHTFFLYLYCAHNSWRYIF